MISKLCRPGYGKRQHKSTACVWRELWWVEVETKNVL
jgi:hypothetical protein